MPIIYVNKEMRLVHFMAGEVNKSRGFGQLGRVVQRPFGRVMRRMQYLAFLRKNEPVKIPRSLQKIPCFSYNGFRQVVGDYEKFIESGDYAHLSRAAVVGFGYLSAEGLALCVRQRLTGNDPDEAMADRFEHLTTYAAAHVDIVGNALLGEQSSMDRPWSKAQRNSYAAALIDYPQKDFQPTKEERKLLVIALLLMGHGKFCLSRNGQRRKLGGNAFDDYRRNLQRIAKYFQDQFFENVPQTRGLREDCDQLLNFFQRKMPKSLQVIRIQAEPERKSKLANTILSFLSLAG